MLEASLAALCQKKNITSAQFQSLAALRRRSPAPLTAAQIMKASVLSSGSVTSMIDQLVRKKLVKKSQSKVDRRQVEITLTPLGQKIIEELLEIRVQELETLAGGYSKQEQKSLSDLLRRILVDLDPSEN